MTLAERLDRGTVVVMDGGIGTEIQRRGHIMDARAWSGIAHMRAPEGVRRIHEDYIRAGAEIVTSNTFATARLVLESAGRGADFEAVNRRAVEIAAEARDSAAEGPVWIAGSLSSMPPLTEAGATARGEGLEEAYRHQAEILAEAGADLLLAEMMMDEAGATPVVRAAAGVGLPLWVGFSAAFDEDGRVVGFRTPKENHELPPEDFGGLVDAVLPLGGDVAGVMHSEVSATGPALDILSARWTGPKMAYAETGRFANPEWVFEEAVSAEDYAAAAEGWVRDQGVQIVGGCCGTGPDHIRALTERLVGQRPAA